MVDDIAPLSLALLRVLQQHTQAVRSVTQDDQGKQEVGHTLRRLPCVLPETNILNITRKKKIHAKLSQVGLPPL